MPRILLATITIRSPEKDMFARLSLLVVAVAAALAIPRAAIAQQSASQSLAGPRVELTASALRRAAVADTAFATDSLEAAMQRRTSTGKPVALMIVGGAAFVLGAVIDEPVGTLFMVGGAVAFLYGLYQYLK
jgi:hypothetical protein